jgi:hypothetical protein
MGNGGNSHQRAVAKANLTLPKIPKKKQETKSVSVAERGFRFWESGMIQTLLSILGGLAGTFLDGRYFMFLTPLVPAAIHRNKVLEGVEQRKSVILYVVCTSVVALLLFWCGTSLNKSRPNTFTPKDYADAVKKVLPVVQPPTSTTTIYAAPAEVFIPPKVEIGPAVLKERGPHYYHFNSSVGNEEGRPPRTLRWDQEQLFRSTAGPLRTNYFGRSLWQWITKTLRSKI